MEKEKKKEVGFSRAGFRSGPPERGEIKGVQILSARAGVAGKEGIPL